MNIELHNVTVRELTDGYADKEDLGVRGFGGRLDVRPPYQREFVYKEKERNAVINTVWNGFPLNTMYWVKRDGEQVVPYEVLDGQQRTISICQYVNGDFMYSGRYFENLKKDEQERILSYKLMVYICSGTDSEKLDWFRTVNIAGEELTPQELRNAVYAGSFVGDAKRYFSKNQCAAYREGNSLVMGAAIRQEYLETAIKWICLKEYGKDEDAEICRYMAEHQHDADAVPLWNYYRCVVDWAKSYFTVKGREKIVKGLDWGGLYNEFHEKSLDRDGMEKEIRKLLIDDDVQRKRGIIPYVLTRKEKCLNLRTFKDEMKLNAYERQNHKCAVCGRVFEYRDMEGDHIISWCEGGKTVQENCQMLCRECNREKGSR